MVDYASWLERGACWVYIINLDENTFEVFEKNWNNSHDTAESNNDKLFDNKYILKERFDLNQIPRAWDKDLD